MMNKLYFIAFFTILRRELKRFLRTWPQSLLPSVINMALYFVIFGQILGSTIGTVEGMPYIKYIAPGLIMMAIINNSYTNVVFSLYLMRFSKSIEELLVAPIPNTLILSALVTGGIIRAFLIAVLVTIIALFFTHLHIHSITITFATAFLTALLFSLAGFLNALFARRFDDTAIIPTFVLTPLNYLGGIFYSINLLPGIWHTIALCNPILYMINAFRYGLLGITDVSLSTAFISLIACNIVLLGINLYLLNRGTGIRP